MEARYDERTIVGREVKTAKGYYEGIIVPQDAPEGTIDTVAVSNELRDIESQNREITMLKDTLKDAEEDIKDLEAQLTEAKEARDKAKLALKGKKLVDTKSLQDKLASASAINLQYQQVQNKKEASKKLKELEKKQDEITLELEEILSEKEKLITSAKLPIKGLNIDAVGVTFNGIPFTQLSSAEQLKVSLAIAMAMNPKLRVMRIMDGSLLDSDNMEVIKKLAKNEDYQVWIERVEDGGKVGILIENGEVKTI